MSAELPVDSLPPETQETSSFDPVPQLCAELSLPERGIRSVIQLLAEGATVPFIARYRKEATGGLDEVQIRAIGDRRAYLIELETRRASILAEIQKQGKLTEPLKKKIQAAATKAELEDLYLPYKPKRRTRAMIAIERGLEPLAELIWAQGSEGNPETAAAPFVKPDKEVESVKAALAGARDIIAERLGDDADLRKAARELYLETGVLVVEKTAAHAEAVTKFDNYANFSEPVKNIASHRFLAVRRGEAEGVLRSRLTVDEGAYIEQVTKKSPLKKDSPFAGELELAIKDAATRILLTGAQVDVRVELKMRADRQAIEVFATNLRELLMAPPFGPKAVLGIDPGQRTGCKCAVVDTTGKLLAHETIYLVGSPEQLKRAEQTIISLLQKYPVNAVAVGNGTHGRETEAFVKGILKNLSGYEAFCVSVSESGASVYSASDIAREEFPDLDLTIRGAISIARRLQDPLAELVKVDPKSIGVGQYQHDVFQGHLSKKLDEVVESCVHEVGVELNTASAPLLARVSGLGESLARRIVMHRNTHGAFKSRKELLSVPGLGPRAFEQAAGFLRINGAENPLDGSAVHPERYALVEKIAQDLGVPVAQMIGNRDLLARIDRARYQVGDVGSFTLDDIFAELLKPGRDPRKSFERAKFRDDVSTLADLKVGMVLEGAVTNVTAFGAFVDIGVHQDGLVHISRLSDKFVKDPAEVVKVGDRITVTVIEVDLERGRISLSARKGDGPAQGASGKPAETGLPGHQPGKRPFGGNQSRGFGGGGRPGGHQGGPKEPRAQTGPGGQKLTHNPFADLMKRS
ncbi:MAG: RNA-binding transcriptional accessory protein [Sorangiineae bacterium NIC37A_2]|jgi:uncharacterized protein|nr:MAG: RNA-binding transcriptional accessory protein [Sorangiineae bacterium NIC37A_2]